MPALNQDLTAESGIPIGDGFPFAIDVPDMGPASEITAARWALSLEPDGAAVIELTLAGGGIVVSDLEGGGVRLLITISSAQTAALAKGNYRHQASATQNGVPKTVTLGAAELLPTIGTLAA